MVNQGSSAYAVQQQQEFDGVKLTHAIPPDEINDVMGVGLKLPDLFFVDTQVALHPIVPGFLHLVH